MSIEEVRTLLGMTGVTVSEERLKALAETMTDYRPKVELTLRRGRGRRGGGGVLSA